jgi:hypothetical protein
MAGTGPFLAQVTTRISMQVDFLQRRLLLPQPATECCRAMGTAAALLIAVMVLIVPRQVSAQAAWEFSPYDMKVCVALSDEPEFTPAFASQVRDVLASRADMVFFASWKLAASSPNAAVEGLMLTHLEQLTFDDVKAGDAKLVQGDKLYLLAITRDRGDYVIRGRELDLRTRMMGPMAERRCGTLQEVPFAGWDAITATFIPLAKIENVQEKAIAARVRAGGLITDPASPALIQPGDALRVIIRRNDRSGEPSKNGIQPLAWTVLSVQSRHEALLDCTIASGYRTPIPQRANVRMERLAVVARPQLPTTRLILNSRGKDPHPLTGYEVFVKGIDDQPTQLLGVTDWRGAIEIPRGDVLVRTLYVKNGNQLLARLPLVPGDQREAVATTIEDDYRLQTEGFVMALQGRVTDLVARREILAARIRKQIKEGKFAEAEILVKKYGELESRDDFIKELDSRLGDIADHEGDLEKVTQVRINKMVGDARNLLLNKYLNPETKNVLAKEVEDAKAGKVTAAATPGS